MSNHNPKPEQLPRPDQQATDPDWHRSVFNNLPDALFIADANTGILIDANPAALTLIGKTRDQVVGRHFTTLHPPGTEALYRQRFFSNQPNHWEFDNDGHVRHADGSVIPVAITTMGLNHPNGQFLMGLFRDISRRARAENALKISNERYRLLVENLPDIIMRFDRHGRCLYASPSLERYGMSIESAIGRTHAERGIDPRYAQFWDRHIQQVIKTGQSIETEFHFPTPQGLRYFEWRLFPECDTDHQVHTIVSVARDITEKHEAEQQRQSLQQELQQSQKMQAVGQIAGGMAHELKNLVTALMGYTGTLHQETDRPESDHALLQIDRVAFQIHDMVQSLLTFAKPVDQPHRPIDLTQCMLQVIDLLAGSLPKGIKLHHNLIHCQPICIIGNASAIQQTVLNLAINAQHAMPDGGRLEIELHDNAQQSTATIHVRDTGSGIDQTHVDRIFEPFFTTKPAGTGTGLGLAVAMRVIQDMKGNIQVQSTPGKGTCMTIHLPTCDAAHCQIMIQQPRKDCTGHILLIESDPIIGSLLGQELRQCGATVCHADNTDQAQKYLAQPHTPIDLLIAPPGADLPAPMTLIVLEADAKPPESKTHWIQKPFTIEAITQRISLLLHATH